MKITKRVTKGINLALDAFCRVYETNTHLLTFAILSVLVGVPAFVYVMCFLLGNPGMLLFVNPSYIEGVRDLAGPVDMSKMYSLLLAGLVATPFVGFFYAGIIKSVDTKKRFNYMEAINAGVMPLKKASFWVLALLVAVANLYIMSMINLADPNDLIAILMGVRDASVAMLICHVICIVSCFAIVGYLIKKDGVVESITNAFRIILNNFLEVVFGSLTWLVVSLVSYFALFRLLMATLEKMNSLGGMLFSNMLLIMAPLQAVWIFVAGIAWIVFVYNVCKTK